MIEKMSIISFLVIAVSGHVIAGPFSHDNVKLVYANGGDDELDVKGIAVEGDKSINKNFFVNGIVAQASDDGGLPPGYSIDGTIIGLGGYFTTMANDVLEIYGGAQIARIKTEVDRPFGSSSDSDSSKDLVVGARVSSNQSYGLSFTIERDIGEDTNETLFELEGRFFISASSSVGLEYEWDTADGDYSGIEVSYRIDFE